MKGIAGTFRFERIMQIDRPGRRHTGVLERPLVDNGLLLENYVAHQTPGFAFAADIGDPAQLRFGKLLPE